MSQWPLLAIAVLYLFAAINLWIEGKPGLALFAAGCVVANVGLILEASR